LGSLAEGLAGAGQLPQALLTIDEALTRSDRNEQRWSITELLRIKGGLVHLESATSAADTAEGLYLRGLEWARRQGALSWELRCATDLARLRQTQGRTKDGYQLLKACYDRFTEGFEMTDLSAAKVLLEELR